MTRPGTPTTEQPYPWVVPDLFRWFGLLLLSAAGLAVAWWGISGTARLSTQITWLNVGVVAVVVGGLGNMTWLLQGRRALAIRRRALLASIPVAELRTAPVAYPDDDGVRMAVPGTTRYHRSGCAAIAGKDVKAMSTAKHERAGRRPCGLCSR
jgi:hypothetical protein